MLSAVRGTASRPLRRAISSIANLIPEPKIMIDNNMIDSSDGSVLEVHAPHTGAAFATIANATTQDVDTAVAAARRCFESDWSATSNVGQRSAGLQRVADALEGQLEDFAKVETADCGKPIVEARADIQMCVDVLRYYAELAPTHLAEQPLDSVDADYAGSIVKEARGVAGLVTPWNYPLMQAVLKVAPALAAGCTMVLKPAPWASLTCIKFAELMGPADIAPGALNLITGGPPGGDAGAYLGEHPDLDVLSFTGSGPTGSLLLHAGADKLRPTSLELGGKGSIIVFDDENLESTVDWIMCGIFLCTGQVCSANSRLLVHEDCADKFLSLLKAKASQIRVGDPFLEETQMGPLVSAPQQTKVLAAIDHARQQGCTVLTGGAFEQEASSALSGGYYVQPTILTDLPSQAGSWDDEIFGPVLSVRTFKTEQEAVSMANATEYGLANAVMSSDADQCSRVASKLKSGVVWQNCSQVLFTNTPFGGQKKSGFGRELGVSGLDEYVHHKTVVKTKPGTTWGWYA